MAMLRALFAFVPLAWAAFGVDAEFFELKVRPVLAKNCFSCHTASKMGGLAMTSREALLKGGQSGPSIKPGDPEQSLLIQAVKYSHSKLKMPPSGKLSEAEIEALSLWVKDGGEWPEHKAEVKAEGYRITAEQRAWWSFQPVRKPAPPAVKDKAWVKTPIDQFVLAKLESKGLKPVGPADRRTLIRRAYYDLIGLPPTHAEVEAFVNDRSPEAYAKVIDRLLGMPQYGERWGRHWLDVARYADERMNSTADEPIPNAWRYRDWVIQAMNRDMPYDLFLKAQIAGDQLPNPEETAGGLGFFALSPEQQDDRVDALTRGVMALTVACAQCHDHKFDPIPTKDYYSLLGVFRNTKKGEYPLAPKETVAEYKARKAAIEAQEKKLNEFLNAQAEQLGEILAGQAAAYLAAARGGERAAELDEETLKRLKEYLERGEFEHPFLKNWQEGGFDAAAFQAKLLKVFARKKEIDRENLIALGGKDDDRIVRVVEVKSLERDDYFLWRDFFSPARVGKLDAGVFYYRGTNLDRWLAAPWKRHADALRAELEDRKKALPPMYPYYQIVEDVDDPKNIRVEIRGSRENLGDEVPRQFLEVLTPGERKPFTKGSGRLELAEAVANPHNPLTARAIVNRIWMIRFGRAIVGTPGNFGQLGEKPSNPELLDYLAARLVEQGWSLKALHKEMMLSAAYQLSARAVEPNQTQDPENSMTWRWTRRRLDIEPLRDTLLAVTGELDRAVGGEPFKLSDNGVKRRTVYGSVSRRKLDGTLALFDFPNPVATSEQRILTATPLQQLFFLNSEFIQERAKTLAARVAEMGGDDAARIRAAYRMILQREALPEEIRLGVNYLKAGGEAWPRYAQALLSSNELLFIN
jgi:mono/diheme cytochrome c family protein